HAGSAAQAAALLEPIVAAAGATRLEERLFLEGLRRSGDPRPAQSALSPLPDGSGDLAIEGRRGGRLLSEGRRVDSLAQARALAESGQPGAPFDAAAIAAGASERNLAVQWARQALARGLDATLLH